jgi:hypothetical protein
VNLRVESGRSASLSGSVLYATTRAPELDRGFAAQVK